MNEPTSLLGLQLERDRAARTIKLSQRGAIESFLGLVGMSECRRTLSPMLPNEFFEKTDRDEAIDNKAYRAIVGSLNYFSSMTRPDISYSVGCASQFLEYPSDAHYVMLKRIVRYLAGTSELGLVLGGDDSEKLEIFSDATWASDPYDRKSTSGMVVKLGGSVIAWFSRKQKSVALSSMEAELVAVTAVAKEVT